MSTALPGPFIEQRDVEARVAGVMNLGFGILHQHFEIAAVLEFRADPFGIFFELGGVVGLGKEIFQEDGVRNADRLAGSSSRRAGFADVDVLVAFESESCRP